MTMSRRRIAATAELRGRAFLLGAIPEEHHGPIPQRAIVHGDAVDASIAAASIVAKVHRDALMTELDARHPGYGFARHMGYGTAVHLEALDQLGPCPAHRRSFAPVAAAAHRAR